ncbi:DUF2268 domain-containing protein [Aquibacillus salsiterrae]|uniref:DUF2268 domain-containing protein n=1 Tax=Aquibacillus salsiterrae TaxID=2950439 RepID=A0A9X3WC05_9BACI|nr:DUF2268 domain-containing putative Zn-dependent protease [Aquibacillus salsiterrae]MDC3416957.1 DUF2268 domain-containing protein [Aquibacillus salsiterrae]
MTIIPTSNWLNDYLTMKNTSDRELIPRVHAECLCGPLEAYFPDATLQDIHIHLVDHGLFWPHPTDDKQIETFIARNYTSIVRKILEKLTQHWDGPDVPVFIFPSNEKNRLLSEHFEGVSGVSHPGKLFFFLPNNVSLKKLHALVIHEYSHICRLDKLGKKEEDLTLLDAIVLEGLAENAVRTLLGNEYVGSWAKHPSKQEVELFFRKWIKPCLDLKKTDPLHDQIMYGDGHFPKWLGYKVGYQLIASCLEHPELQLKQMHSLSSLQLLDYSMFAS